MKVPLLVGGNSNVLVFRYTGNGSATFDPSITTSASVSVSWKPDDAPETVTTGTTHNFSYTPSSGSHVCIVRVAGGLGLVIWIDCNTDAVTVLKNLSRTKATDVRVYGNAGLVVGVSDVAYATTMLWSNLDALSGHVSDLNRELQNLYSTTGTRLVGSLSDLPAALHVCQIYANAGISPASIAHLNAIRDIRIYSMGWSSAASVDTVIESIWDARANYTYATPSLQIGGTNPAPTGNYIAPEEGADWHNDGSKWIPLTPNAKAYDLGNDVNDEGFNTWTISKN